MKTQPLASQWALDDVEEDAADEGSSAQATSNVESLTELEALYAEKTQELEHAVSRERRYLMQDPTVEKAGELALQNPDGLTLFRDELSGWLLSLGKAGREGDREYYLEAANGTGPYTVDRIGRGTLYIPRLTLSVFGCIQPGKLKLLLDDAIEGGTGDDGMMQRLQLLVAPDALPPWKQPTGWGNLDAKAHADALYAALDAMTPEQAGADAGEIPSLRYSPTAQSLADTWRDELEGRLRSGSLDDTPAFASHLSKYRSLMPKLALLFYLIDLAAGTPGVVKGEVGESHVRMAVDWCDFLEEHARKIYAAETAGSMVAAHAIVSKIEAGAIFDGQPVRELYRAQWSGLRTQERVWIGLNELIERNWVRVETRKTGANPSQVIRLHPNLIARHGNQQHKEASRG